MTAMGLGLKADEGLGPLRQTLGWAPKSKWG